MKRMPKTLQGLLRWQKRRGDLIVFIYQNGATLIEQHLTDNCREITEGSSLLLALRKAWKFLEKVKG